jgi:hypothetical protein
MNLLRLPQPTYNQLATNLQPAKFRDAVHDFVSGNCNNHRWVCQSPERHDIIWDIISRCRGIVPQSSHYTTFGCNSNYELQH